MCAIPRTPFPLDTCITPSEVLYDGSDIAVLSADGPWTALGVPSGWFIQDNNATQIAVNKTVQSGSDVHLGISTPSDPWDPPYTLHVEPNDHAVEGPGGLTVCGGDYPLTLV